ncbi:ankyrin repeat-containing domain protein [Fusarium flagelliforme]|uniref:ankyrin repeat-containing domain protein n=1 Tax=Fusarium flagelliforme TaxID=2675880 RepID=UPI001E8E3CE3|nr:ankyrin repeat-containing domain protein [Fusarium flagelliforme]KAH7174918.1 ankyrin repeat-containing domain protein [Fusarium flagelliforme]
MQITAQQSVLRNELDASLNDITMVDQSYVVHHNASNVFPQDDTTLERLHNWLKPTKYTGHGSQLEKHASSHLEGTNQWLTDSSVFQQWHKSKDNGILWIRGASGTGKSVLAAKLIADLVAEERPVLYSFFRRTIESNRRPEAALHDWIAQILPFSPRLQLSLKSLVFKDGNAASVDSLSMAELWHILQFALRTIPKAYLVIDALDEMDQDVMEEFLHLLDQLGNTHPDKLKLVITSRPVATIDKRARNIKSLDIRLDNDQVSPDILKYLQHRIDQVSPLLERREAIVHEILKKAGGLFLYAKLTMDTICEQEAHSHEEVSRAMDKTSLSLLQEYMGRPGLPGELSSFVLQLVTHASRPLRLLEISDCIKVARPEYTQDIGTMKSLIRTSYGPLLEILPDETVRVTHHSLTEYLLRLNQSPADQHTAVFDSGTTHNALALLCLSYLQAGCLDTLVDDTKCVSRGCITAVKNPQLSPFMSYAAANWHVHVMKSSNQGTPQEEVNKGIFSLLTTRQHSEELTLLNKLESSGDSGFWGALSIKKHAKLETKALLISTHLDLTNFTKYLLSRIDTDAVAAAASYPGPPLHKAVLKENLDVVRLLINKGANVSDYDDDGRTPLHLALGPEDEKMRPCHPIIKLLLKVGADPWQMEANYWRWILDDDPIDDADIDDVMVPRPPIEKALRHGDQQVAELFLPYIKSSRMAARAFRWVMLDSKNPKVMRSIMDLGLIDINACIDGETLLFTACQLAFPEAVDMLLEAGADPNIPRDEFFLLGGLIQEDGGENVLHGLAAPERYAVFAKLPDGPEENTRRAFASVVKAGADVNQGTKDGSTPLHMALTPFTARLLLEAGADPLARDKNGLSPFDVAYSDAVMKVLSNKTYIDTRRRDGRTPLLQILSQEDPVETVRDGQPRIKKALKLLDLGADPNVTDNNGNGILHHLAEGGQIKEPEASHLVERVIQAGVNINLRNNQGQTALHKLIRPYLRTIDLKILLEVPDVDVNVLDNNGKTILFGAMESGETLGGDEELMDIMVKAGAQFNITDIRGRTLLHAFMEHIRGNERTLEILIERGVNPRQPDHEGNTIWHEAATYSYFFGLDTIKGLGVDPTKPNNRGRTPLHVVCGRDQPALRERFPEEGQAPLFQYLLKQSSDIINNADDDGVVALHMSTFSEVITRRLLEAGADATLATNEGLNAFHLASRYRQSNVIGLLIDWFGAKRSAQQLVEAVNFQDKRGRSPLYYAAASGHYQSVDLLIKAGAVPVIEAHEGSALYGCVDFEMELKNWRKGDDRPKTGSVHIDGTDRLKEDDRGSLELFKFFEGLGYNPHVFDVNSYEPYGIDDILRLLISSAPSVSSHAIDRAIVQAASHLDNDYTVEALVRAREPLGGQESFSYSEQVRASLQRRAKVPSDITTRRLAGHSFSQQIEFMLEERLYDAIPSFIAKYSPRPENVEIYRVLVKLAYSSYAPLLDDLLTPEVVLDLAKNIGSMENKLLKTEGEDLSPLLIYASQSRQPNLHVIELLAKKGAKVDNALLAVHKKSTALHFVVANAQGSWWRMEQALPFMLKQTKDLELRDHFGLTPLSLSLEGNERPSWSFRATEMLLQAGADPSSVDHQGKSCLARAVGNDSLFRLLSRYGATFDPSSLVAAIVAKDVDKVEMMLASGADANGQRVGWERQGPSKTDPHDRNGLYPLDLLITSTCFREHSSVCERMIELLFKHGADPNSRYPETTMAHQILGRDGLSHKYPPFRGKRNCYADVIVEHPQLDINLQDAAGTPLLHAAYQAGDTKSTKRLIERGADIHARDRLDRNILHQSPDYGFASFVPQMQLQLLETLLTSGPELIHQVDKDGRTPLHCAISRSASGEEIELLIYGGANVHAKDAKGDTALHLLFKQEWILTGDEGDMALDPRKKQIVNLLLPKGFNINVRNEAGDTPVFGYFRGGSLRARTSRGEELRNTPRASTMEIEGLEKEIALERETDLWALFAGFGVDWTVFNNKRQSLLHVVAARSAENEGLRTRRLRMFEFLMNKGLDVFAEDGNGQTALDIAAAGKAEEIMNLFKVD